MLFIFYLFKYSFIIVYLNIFPPACGKPSPAAPGRPANAAPERKTAWARTGPQVAAACPPHAGGAPPEEPRPAEALLLRLVLCGGRRGPHHQGPLRELPDRGPRRLGRTPLRPFGGRGASGQPVGGRGVHRGAVTRACRAEQTTKSNGLDLT